MTHRTRTLAVVGTLIAGAVGVISSTQTWLTVEVTSAHGILEIPGATALPVLAPLSLATLALGLALAIVGPVLRYVFGALAAVIAIVLGIATGQLLAGPTVTHVAADVTAATGITGEAGVAELVTGINVTAWPAVALAGWMLLLAAAVLTLVTGRSWRTTGRRYRTDARAEALAPAASRPHDAIDDWDDLSRGSDPTAGPR